MQRDVSHNGILHYIYYMAHKTMDQTDCAVRAQMGASGRRLRVWALRTLLLMPNGWKALFQACSGKGTVLWEGLVNVSLVEGALAG